MDNKIPKVIEMTNKPFDPTKPYCRRDGKPAKIVHKFNIDTYLVIVEHNFPDEAYYQVGLSGRYLSGSETGKDLVNIPEKAVLPEEIK